MADHFEEAKDDILFRTDGNGGPTGRDLLTAMGALAKDVDESIDELDKKQHRRHTETVNEMKALRNAGNVRDDRLNVIEQKHDAWERECPKRLEAIVCEAVERSAHAHGTTHAEHMEAHHAEEPKRREDDAASDNHRSERRDFPTGDERTMFEVVLAFGAVKAIVLALIIAVSAWGLTYWATSCAEENAGNSGSDIHVAVPSPSTQGAPSGS